MSNPKSTSLTIFPTNIYILILNNGIEKFNNWLFITLSINQLTDKIST